MKMMKENSGSSQYQIAVLKTLKTLKQNAFERPLSEKWEKEQEAKNKADTYLNTDNKNEAEHKTNHKAQFFNWEPKSFEDDKMGIHGLNDNQKGKSTGKGPKIWAVNKDGKTSAFANLEEMKYSLDRTVDEKVKLRTDRKLIFRDPNPWTYTPEQAAQLGLLDEVPKDYFQKQQEKKRMEILDKRHRERYGKPLGYDINNDDGSELNPGKVEYHRKGKVTTFTQSDMPHDPEDDKEVEDMTEEEYEQWLKDERGWANWKDDNEKGAGNPYYH
eukprot:CAMPEP_0201575964 /NCGR_PEP_ID=MMETSP0190_2-20130828/21471_1 /ASSEMBLY_ACC=CAM_ASM_000263 /TAXON_ID=37353 /ORGANISM="Rosalina sp." /LENGTH=271 /DNA_ID=CAMNT_0048006253 /DNA_START=570 /DNA_END=1384 /DNA_ORIENTATION=+